MGEWTKISSALGSLDVIYRFTGDLSRPQDSLGMLRDVPEDSTRVIAWLTGTHTLREVCRLAGMTEYAVGRIVLALKSAGLLVLESSTANRRPNAAAVLAEHRTCALALFHSGLDYYARQAFEKVLGGDPRDPVALFYLALMKAESADPTATATLTTLLDDPVVGTSARLNLAVLEARRGRSDVARAHLARLLGPEDCSVSDLLARAYAALEVGALGDAESALARYGRVTPGPESVDLYYFLLGNLHMVRAVESAAVGNPSDARLHWAKARAVLSTGVQQFPDAWALQGNYAYLLVEQNDLESAGSVIERALASRATAAFLYVLRGDVASRERRTADAFESYQHAISLDPALGPGVYAKLAFLAQEAGEPEQAVQYANTALRFSSDPEPLARRFADQMIGPLPSFSAS